MSERSWYNHRTESAKRRDVRNDKPDDTPKAKPSKKDRKRWCRGKVGVEHTPKCMTYAEAKPGSYRALERESQGWKILVCTKCGRELDRYYPMRWHGVTVMPDGTLREWDLDSAKPVPDWAK